VTACSESGGGITNGSVVKGLKTSGSTHDHLFQKSFRVAHSKVKEVDVYRERLRLKNDKGSLTRLNWISMRDQGAAHQHQMDILYSDSVIISSH
jgi:hypothetical protein